MTNSIDNRVARQETIVIEPLSGMRPETMLKVIKDCDSGHQVILRYVPDRYLLSSDAFQQYIAILPTFDRVHEMAFIIMDDLNNQLVPKWIQVIVHYQQDSALIEDRQPQWTNPALLSRQVIY